MRQWSVVLSKKIELFFSYKITFGKLYEEKKENMR